MRVDVYSAFEICAMTILGNESRRFVDLPEYQRLEADLAKEREKVKVLEAYAKHERSLGAEKAMASDLREQNAAWWALVMGAAAALEDAANFLSDSDAKRAAEGAANHYRREANERRT